MKLYLHLFVEHYLYNSKGLTPEFCFDEYIFIDTTFHSFCLVITLSYCKL